MISKIIRNDIRKSKLITAAITAFIFIAAVLTSLSAALIVNLFGAIDNMALKAKTPHYLQMHSGDVDMERLRRFVNMQSNIEAFQVLEFLNIEGAKIKIGDNTLASSVQDNGLSSQSRTFDFLLDLSGKVIYPSDNEIYVPLYYMKSGAAKVGDTITIYGVTFTVVGFLRDSMMNPAITASKRFLVSESDFEKIRKYGSMEYLIEFRLKDISKASALESEYLGAGLPSNGPPAITIQILILMNAITDGVMIAVLMFISVLVIAVAFLCIRFTLIAKVEDDYREIGILKAIGLRVSNIKSLYTSKYGAIAGFACVLGFLVSIAIQAPFMENIRLYMGESGRFFQGLLFGFLGAAVIFLAILLYVSGVLRRFRKISVAQAIRFGAPREKSNSARIFLLSKNRLFSANTFLGILDVLSRKKLYVTMLMVLVISTFIMIVPQNIYNTVSSRNFMTYMGIGVCDMRIDIPQTQTDNIGEKTAEIAEELARDRDVLQYTVLTNVMLDAKIGNDTLQKINVELGDHTAFPISYSSGRAPRTEAEIALSTLNAGDLGKSIGEEIILIIDGEEKRLIICGIFSDITNGGKTAKAIFKVNQGDILWTTIPVAFYDSSTTEMKVSQYKNNFPFAKVANIEEYSAQMFGSTVSAIKTASYVSIAAAIMLTVLITLLFMKMLVVKDRHTNAILKSVGFTGRDIRKQYVTRSIIVLALGVVIGTILANTIGELLGVAIISSFGASSFHFVVNPLFAYVFSPLLIALCVYIAAFLGVSDIRFLKIADYIKEE